MAKQVSLPRNVTTDPVAHPDGDALARRIAELEALVAKQQSDYAALAAKKRKASNGGSVLAFGLSATELMRQVHVYGGSSYAELATGPLNCMIAHLGGSELGSANGTTYQARKEISDECKAKGLADADRVRGNAAFDAIAVEVCPLTLSQEQLTALVSLCSVPLTISEAGRKALESVTAPAVA